VDYTGEKAHVILGELPFPVSHFPESRVRDSKLCSLERYIIPVFSVEPVLTFSVYPIKKVTIDQIIASRQCFLALRDSFW